MSTMLTAPPAPPAPSETLAGVKAMVPLMLAVTPQGLSLGVALGQMPGHHLTAWATSGLIYSGSAQLALMTTYATSGVAAIVVTLIINLRLVLYSAALAPQWRRRSLGWRLLAGHLLIDPSFIQAQQRPRSTSYFMGGAVILFAWWQVVTGVGILAPALIPHLGALWAAAPLCFVALLAGSVKERTTFVAAGVAFSAALALGALPYSLGLVVAIAAGLAAAVKAGKS
jgi:predicted branched-subunit amino acid permease